MEFSSFCYNLALEVLLFLGLFGIKFATTKQFILNSPQIQRILPQILVLLTTNKVPSSFVQFFMQNSIVVCRRVKTDTQNTSKTGLAQAQFQSRVNRRL
jgi:hypothetical protein